MSELRDIPGFEGRYAVTDDGRVWSHPKSTRGKYGGWMKARMDPAGYPLVTFRADASAASPSLRLRVHRLVAMAFLPPAPSAKHEINHRSGVKNDNRVANLEWVTCSGNLLHAHAIGLRPDTPAICRARSENGKARRKLTLEQVATIKVRSKTGVSAAAIARDLGVSGSTVEKILLGTSYKDYT